MTMTSLEAQIFERDSIRQTFIQTAAFSSYKDNYFIMGTTLDEKPNKINTNVKFQVSFKQRLTDAVLPFHTYLYMTYTQKSIWRILAESSPFAESNYNPALGIGKGIFYKGTFRGIAALTVEHESNGRDSIFSRSWNRVILHYTAPLSHQSILLLHVWIPFLVAAENADLLKFTGYGEANFHYLSNNKRFTVDITGRKGWSWDRRGSLETQLSYRLSQKGNQYIGLQWFRGYNETLIMYNQRIQMIRLGLIIKPVHLLGF